MTRAKSIRLRDIETAKKFVSMAGNCDFDIDVFQNKIVIDGKSILGVLSLDLQNEVHIKYYGESKDFEEYLQSIEVAG